jgi:hypothetical protein
MAERAAKRRKTGANKDTTNQDAPENSDTPLSISGTGSAKHPSTPPLTQSPPRTRYSHADLVTLLVGPDEHKLLAFGHQLSENSEFFKSALKDDWVEGQTRTVKLPEDDEEQITHYLDFMHGHGLPTKSIDTFAALDDFDPKDEDDSYGSLFELYVLGERTLDKNIQQATIKEVLRLTTLKNNTGGIWLPGEGTKALTYEGTASRSPARRLAVDLQVNFGHSTNFDQDLPIDYIRDVARAFNAKLDAGSEYTSEDFRWQPLNVDDYVV